MDFEFETHRAETVCRIRGELDIATAPLLQSSLIDVCRQGGSLVVDCSAVTFIDSVGLRTLVAARDEARRIGTSLALRDVPRSMRRLLEITGLDGAFRLTGHDASGRSEPTGAGVR